MKLELEVFAVAKRPPTEAGYYLAWENAASRATVVYFSPRDGWRRQSIRVAVTHYAGPIPERTFKPD